MKDSYDNKSRNRKKAPCNMSDRNDGDMQHDGLRITLFKYREK